MKHAILIIAIVIISSNLMGCANRMQLKLDESAGRINNLAQNAKNNLAECLTAKDKKDSDLRVCDDIEANLIEIINTSNELSDIFKK